MANFNPADSGYVEVKDRIEAFYQKYPEGSLQSEIVMLTDNKVVVKAYAYRFLEDTRPGIGHSQLALPGKTNYTRDSELENAETSAWGRAIAALGFEVKRSVASSDEIRMKQDEQSVESRTIKNDPPATPRPAPSDVPAAERPATQAQKNLIRAKAREFGITDDELKAMRLSVTGKQSSAQFTSKDVDAMLGAIESAAEAKKLTGGEIVG